MVTMGKENSVNSRQCRGSVASSTNSQKTSADVERQHGNSDEWFSLKGLLWMKCQSGGKIL